MLSMQYFTEGQYSVNDDSCVRVDHSSYAARPAAIGSRVLVRLFAHRLEIHDLKTQALLRTQDRAEKPGTVVLPMNECVFNPSRETQRILSQAKAIGAATHKLCETLFEREGRVQLRPCQDLDRAADGGCAGPARCARSSMNGPARKILCAGQGRLASGHMSMPFTSTQKPHKSRSINSLKKQPDSLHFRRQLP